MSNIETTNNDIGTVEISGGDFRDEQLTFGGAGTVLEGTILARDNVSLKLVPYVKGGSANENGIPKAVMTYPVTSAGAGDVSVRPLVAGRMNGQRLVIDADGDNANVDAEVIDQLRSISIVALHVGQLGQYA